MRLPLLSPPIPPPLQSSQPHRTVKEEHLMPQRPPPPPLPTIPTVSPDRSSPASFLPLPFYLRQQALGIRHLGVSAAE